MTWQKAIIGTALVVASAATSSATERTAPVLVQWIIDGDTIVVQGLGHVRLLGIDAPELGYAYDTPAPFAREARDRLASLIVNRWVILEYDGRTRFDKYNRRLAYVLLEAGPCINTLLVQEGLARVTAHEPLLRLQELKRAETEAQIARRGIWSASAALPGVTYRTRRAPRPHTAAVRRTSTKTSSKRKRHRKRSRSAAMASMSAASRSIARAARTTSASASW